MSHEVDIYKSLETLRKEAKGTSQRFSALYEPRMKWYEFFLPGYMKKRNDSFMTWFSIKQAVQRIVDVKATFDGLGADANSPKFADLMLSRLDLEHTEENMHYARILTEILPFWEKEEVEKNAFQVAVASESKNEDIRRLVLYTVIGCKEDTVADYKDLPFSYLSAVVEVLYDK